jgi:hypothetical protein
MRARSGRIAMKRLLLTALLAVTFPMLTGLQGCDAYDVEIVQPPGTDRLEDALVVVTDSRSGEAVVVPYPEFVKAGEEGFHSIEDLRRNTHPVGP